MLKYRADYRPPACKVISAGLDISIFEDRTFVTTTLELERVGDDAFLVNGRDLTLHELSVNGRLLDEADWPVTEGGLSLEDLPAKCAVRIRAECHPESNSALEGLYLSGGMYCTQCEPEGFRRIGFFPDRPDVMTVFTVRIEAGRQFPQLLSNGNLVETGEIGDDRHYALWHDPHPKPSYLFACVVGDLDLATDSFTTASGRDVDLHIYVEKGNTHLTGHGMESLKRSMKWDEDTYGLEYDLDLFQIVAVSHFNMGAMENKGLNIFNSKYVLADPSTATDEDLHRVNQNPSRETSGRDRFIHLSEDGVEWIEGHQWLEEGVRIADHLQYAVELDNTRKLAALVPPDGDTYILAYLLIHLLAQKKVHVHGSTQERHVPLRQQHFVAAIRSEQITWTARLAQQIQSFFVE